ncbi:E3 ubiquitin-protein ligase lubel-like isoform X18 [Penaeus chinensis]|uniref:E3 ubiquitin-protein ligase lubel-like isoform X18 n=1 Tax=Penaeus chinensis TaxID=139456 RepID=UPI001FB6A7B8|nr:E3 ubiquitin-protein ligase lubel-like isoform X18 [Penaeus chinensis]
MVGTKDAVRPPRGKPDDKEKRSPLSRLRLNYSFLQVGSGDRKHHEPEYEEVGPPTGLRKNTDNGTKGDGVHCDLCGSAPAAVRCDRCGSQTFCLSCDDMYHRHPRRSSHVRKAVDSKAPSGGGVRPPLPPKGDTQGAPPPQPPPRKNKRSGFGFSKKDQNYHSYSGGLANITSRSSSMTNLQSAASDSVSGAGRTIMGSLKKFMGARPLPPTPDQVKASAKNDNRDSVPSKALIRASTSPSLPNLSDQTNDDIRAGLPQSILELNRSRPPPKNSTSTPATPASPNAQYPPLQPKTQQPHAHTHSLGRKFSLQQLPQAGMEDKRTSLVEPSPGGVGWESETPKPMPRNRSQSISDDQWAQVMASQGGDGTGGPSGPSCPPGHTPADMSAFVGATTRRGYNTMGGRGSSFGRGMVSSASVCDLNSLAQQQPPHGFNSSHPASSFQQLNMMGYPGGMPMWGAPCDLCTPAHMLAGQANVSGMKRTASNLSMNLSSVGSDVTGYPWGPPPPHMHHHMPPMFPGYYPGYHPHMGPPAMGSLNMSIPDSMNTFGKVPSSPAPSLRSSSHRSHKSSKSRSFSGADVSGRRSRNRRKQRSEESEESRSSSVSDDDDDGGGRNNKVGSSLAWQCDHCTFINSGGVRTCGMCSKTMGGGGGGGGSGRSSRRGSERHRSDRRRDRRTDHEDDDRDVSDYDNDGGVVKSNLSFNIKDNRRESRTKVSNSSKSKSKKKSRRRGSSASASESASDGEEERLERHMRDLRVSSSSRRRGSDYESVSNKDRDRDRDRDRDKGSRKREGGSSRFKNRGKSHSERSRTPGRQTPRRESPVEDAGSRGGSRERSPTEDSRSSHHSPSEDRNDHNSSHEDTVVNTVASEVTAKSEHKSKSDSSKRSRSRARSQAEEVADEVQVQVEAAPVEQEPLEAKSRTPSPRQQARNSKSPAPSQRDGDEHSFANTLDEITTMGTNEMADQDLSSHYIDERIIMQPAEAHDEIPEVIFVRPKTPDEEAVAEKATAAADQLMAVNGETNVAEVQPAVPEPVVKPISRIPPSEPVYEPRYEPIEEPVLNEPAVAAAEPDSEQPDYQTATMGMSAGDKEPLGDRDDEQGGDDTLVEATRPMAVADVRGGEGLRSGSSGSSLGINNTPPDRQYTPLSFSSSDAQFYSPPDSPDISLSEQLQDKPLPSNTQTVKAHSDDYLVSALETMQTAQTGDDLKSSRETIRSSFEQLPYSEEAFEREAEAPARPASAGAAVPPTDGYESLSFKDALTSSEASRKQQQTPPDKGLAAAARGDDAADIASSLDALLQEAERQSKALEAEVSEKHMTVEQIINKRRQETMERQGLELVQTLRSAEEAGYTTEDVSIALAQSGDKNPLEWLKENWRHMVDTVLTLATNYGHERRVNDVGAITAAEAKSALRVHKGNIWAAVTECVEQRQKKFNDILSRGNFQRQEVVRALETNDGDADAALQELNKPQQHQPFTMKIWAPPQAPEGQTPKPVSSAHAQVEVQDAPPAPPSPPPPAPPPPPPAPVEPPAAPPTIAGTKQERSDKKAGEVSRFEEPGMAQTRPGPVTMQKATAIVGKAIAKAMARETSVRESLSRSVTPEIGQDAPMVTPEPSEEEEETVGQAPITDSEDDDHLRTLDTIPEEEEISEMTESGRIISRSASKNLFLPFNPTDVVHLNAVGRGVATAAAASPRPSASSTVKVASDEKSGTPSEAGRPASIPERADESVSEAPHNYYNDPKYNYYNAAAGAEDAPAEEPPVKLAPNDYETMYEVKRELDSLRDTSEVTMGKLNALITNEAQDARDNDDEGIYYEEVVLKSGIDPSSQAKTEAGSEPSTTTPSRRRRRRRRRGRGQGEGGEAGASRADQSEPSAPASSSLSSAPPPQAPADTSPPPPETTPSASPAESSPAQAEAEASPSASNPVLLDPAETPAEAATTKAAGGRRRARLSDSKTYSMIEIVSTKTKEEAADSSQPAEGAASTAAGTRRRRPRTAAGAADAGSSSTTNQSSDYAAATASTTSSTRTRSRARVSESSGDSEDDDRPSRVSEEDPSKIPHLLVQIEGLKARQKKESDYQEVRELKEQIQQMRKQLEAKMEEEGKRPDTPETPKDEHPPPGPLADPQEPAEEQTKMTSPEEEQLNFDRTVRRLLAEGHAGSYEKAELAAHLMNFSFDEANSLQAAEECSSIYTALQFLQQECELCAEKYPMGKMVSMLQCTHRCCCECAKTYYTFQIKTKNIRDLRCPFCNEPDLDACEEIANEYLNNMDILLKTILDSETHELFQRKLRDWTLMKDPNFRWCNKCSSGFIANPRARKLICPDCKDVTCASCRAPWEASHEGISCEAFARWKNDNDLEAQAQGVAKHLAECGITCPKCKFTYALAKGGCMHFTCTQCKYEFCSGCGQPFRQGSKCPVGPYCERLGLHSHHPRNCLFYLRDKEPHQLQNLLKEAGITYDTEPPEMWEPGKSCQVQEQKELPDGLKDDVCGRTVPNGYAGLCRIHFVEYLAWLIFKNKIDPLETLDEEDLRFVIRRENLAAPKRIPWESKDAYRQKLLQLIKEHLPLDSTV